MPNSCAVLNCGSTALTDGVSFFRIPSIYDYSERIDARKQRRRDAWIAALRRSDLTETTLKYVVVCSKHFIRGKPAQPQEENDPDWIPTQRMGCEKYYKTYGRRKRMKLDTDDSRQDEVADNCTVALSAELMQITQELLDNIVIIKQEVDDDAFSNDCRSQNYDSECTANSVIKEESEICNDLHLHIKREEIDIKDEALSSSNESCDNENVECENFNEFGLSSVASQNCSDVIKLQPGYSKAHASTLPFVTMDMIHDFYLNIYLLSQLKASTSSEKTSERYGDEAIEYVQLLRQTGTVTLKCTVAPDRETKDKTYEATIIINERDRIIETCECVPCSAAKVGCKHALAFLYWLHRRMEVPSGDQDECFWIDPVPNIENKQFVMCKDFGEVPESSDVNESNFFQLFIQNAPKGSKALILRYHGNQPSADLHKLMVQFVKGDFYLNADSFLNFCKDTVTTKMCDDMFKKTTQQSQAKLWQELRYGRITSSTFYAASRWNPYGTLIDLILGVSNICDSKSTKREEKLKRFVLEEVAKLRMIHILSPAGLLLQPDYPIFGASVDGVTDEYCILVKCPLKESKMTKYIVGDKIKEKFYCQIMLQLHLCGKQKGLFCVAAPDFEKTKTVHVIEVIYDGKYLMEKIEEASRFWRENIFPVLLKTCQS